MLAAATSGCPGPAAARGTELKVAGPGEAAMKPSSEEEEEAVRGVGPWNECFEVAVQLALRAGQVSTVATSSPEAPPRWAAWACCRRVGGCGASCKDRACVVSGAHLVLTLHPPAGGGGELGEHGVTTMARRRAQPSGKREGRVPRLAKEWPTAGYLTLAFESPGKQTSLPG